MLIKRFMRMVILLLTLDLHICTIQFHPQKETFCSLRDLEIKFKLSLHYHFIQIIYSPNPNA
jgi:hypothetical protein